MKRLTDVLCNLIFWVWNLVFLLLVYVGFLPSVGPFLVRDGLLGEIPLTFLVSFAGIILVPTICTLVGWFRLRQQPTLLMRLFYGVEAPIFALCLLRLFVIRELTPASTQILSTLALCILAFAIELLCGYIARWRTLSWLQMMGHSLMLIIGVYVGVLLTFYTVPALCVFLFGLVTAVASFISSFFQFQWLDDLGYLITSGALVSGLVWLPLSLFLFGFSCTLFFAMPFALVKLYVQSWWRIFAAFGERQGSMKAGATTAGVAIAWFLIFTTLQQQPQIAAFQLLDQPPQTEVAQQALLKQSDTIREGLVNAYLSSYRYLSPWEASNQLKSMYRSVFNLSDADAQFWQDFHNHWLSPFLYNGTDADAAKAAELYAQFFDVPIQKAERQAIQSALQSTVNRDETQAGLLNINQRIVWLAEQAVTVQEHGDWADVELYEHYENPTTDDQEIFYSFSLPESAAITGLWLGDSTDRATRFPFTVSPRGAAQQVYKAEVERSNTRVADDPALLEQVGPQQYRLRVFPIPARQFVAAAGRQPAQQKPGHLHLWMTYKVMRQDNGWALPQLTEKRNIFWTNDTARVRNQKRMNAREDWLEASLPAQQHAATLHQIELPGGDRVIARPLTPKDYRLPQSKRFALILDRSRSMAAYTRELGDAFKWLSKNTVTPSAHNRVDLYLTSPDGTNPQRLDDRREFDPTKLTFYGSLQIQPMLRQFAQLKGDTVYDAVLLITDEGSYELSNDDDHPAEIAAPLWSIHLGGKLPPAYDDATLETIQKSRGGVATNLPDVMRRLATEAASGQAIASITDGYAWSVASAESASPTVPPATAAVEPTLAPLAARQLILKLSRERDMTQIAELDRVHAIAKQTAIVTPYSSMLVLVNDRQRELLRQAEASGDRFKREVEDGNDTLSQPNNPLNVATVPEPGNVVGMGVVAIALLLVAKRKPRARSFRLR